jgi:hypothetical protein
MPAVPLAQPKASSKVDPSGGSNDTISLQPVSIEGGTGLNVAGGFASMSLSLQPS